MATKKTSKAATQEATLGSVGKKTLTKVLKDRQEIQESMGTSTKDTRQQLADIKAQQKKLRDEAKALREAAKSETTATTGLRKDIAKQKRSIVTAWSEVRTSVTTFNKALFNTKDPVEVDTLAELLEAIKDSTTNLLETTGNATETHTKIMNIANGVDEDEGELE